MKEPSRLLKLCNFINYKKLKMKCRPKGPSYPLCRLPNTAGPTKGEPEERKLRFSLAFQTAIEVTFLVKDFTVFANGI